MERPPISEACNLCKFYKPIIESSGKCHINPPQAMISGSAGEIDFEWEWPDVSPNDWCGQYKPKDDQNQ